MSFEGFIQRLCKNGHYTSQDAITAMYVGDEEKCSICGEKFVWENLCNETNGSYDDGGNRIDGYVELEEKERKVCEHCKSILEIIYKIPKVETKNENLE